MRAEKLLVESKKFELMLTRRTKAYNSSYSQIALVYLRHFITVHSWNAQHSWKLKKNNETFYFWSSGAKFSKLS